MTSQSGELLHDRLGGPGDGPSSRRIPEEENQELCRRLQHAAFRQLFEPQLPASAPVGRDRRAVRRAGGRKRSLGGPDLFVEAARRLGVEPAQAARLEDALAGVAAGKRGNFGAVVGMSCFGGGESLKKEGADIVVDKLTEPDRKLRHWRPAADGPPHALARMDEIAAKIGDRPLALFLDYDGTLTPIVRRPEDAKLGASMRSVLEKLAGLFTVAIVSGRDRLDVEQLVGLPRLYYAGSHGFDISGPNGLRLDQPQAWDSLASLDRARRELETGLESIPGVQVERKRYAVAVHFRNADVGAAGEIESAVDRVRKHHPDLRKRRGKKIFELQPDIEWGKGRAVGWMINELDLRGAIPMYVGDDVTDEDAFGYLGERGISIRIGSADEQTQAHFLLSGPDEVEEFLRQIGAQRRRDIRCEPGPGAVTGPGCLSPDTVGHDV